MIGFCSIHCTVNMTGENLRVDTGGVGGGDIGPLGLCETDHSPTSVFNFILGGTTSYSLCGDTEFALLRVIA